MWISAEFIIYLIKEFQRLKEQEYKQLGWDIRRNLTKLNYRIHTDAIKLNLIPKTITKEQASFKYAEEADILNIALFGITAAGWRKQNPKLDGNIRDYASITACFSMFPNIAPAIAPCIIRLSPRLFQCFRSNSSRLI
jgi:hypothetical protein